MNIVKNAGALLVAVAASVAFSSVASANELLVTPSQSKGASPSIALDIVSDGDVSGFQFALDFGNAKIAKADVSRCLSELPSSFAGKCQQVGSKIYVIAMANQMTTLPAGIVPVGSVTVSAPALGRTAVQSKAQTFKITEMEFVDVKGNVLQTQSKISE